MVIDEHEADWYIRWQQSGQKDKVREKYRDRDKIGHIERKAFQCADRWRVLEPTSPSTEEKQSLWLNSWMGKAATVGRTLNVHSEICLLTWLLQRLSKA